MIHQDITYIHEEDQVQGNKINADMSLRELFIKDDVENKVINDGPMTLDAAADEFKETFAEREAYQMIMKITGPCYKWDAGFIDAILYAMSTDSLIRMTKDEQKMWIDFVNFQDLHSTSARDNDANGTAIGCTNPDHLNRSYVVSSDGSITDQICQQPTYEILGEDYLKSLDRLLMDLYECNPINDCQTSDDVVPISSCITQ